MSRYRITAEDRQWVDEFRQRPLGPHSPNLQRVLNAMRGGATAGKYCLICSKPFAEWQLARMSGRRGDPAAERVARETESLAVDLVEACRERQYGTDVIKGLIPIARIAVARADATEVEQQRRHTAGAQASRRGRHQCSTSMDRRSSPNSAMTPIKSRHSTKRRKTPEDADQQYDDGLRQTFAATR